MKRQGFPTDAFATPKQKPAHEPKPPHSHYPQIGENPRGKHRHEIAMLIGRR